MPRNHRQSRASTPASAPAPGGLRFVNSGDTRIAYRVIGRGDLNVFVLQPFWTSMADAVEDRRSFISQIAHSQRVIVHDRRGTGESERHPAQMTTELMVDDLFAVLTDAGVDSTVLVAMGESGPLALHAAARRPDRVSRVVLVDPALRPLKGPGSAMLLHTLHSRPRAGLRALARTLVDDDLQAAELGGQMASAVDGPTAAQLYEAFLDADSFAVLDDVTMPVLLAYGVFDRLSPDNEARSLQGALPNARIGIVSGPAGGEAAMREAWVQIRDFLEEEAARRRPIKPLRIAPQLDQDDEEDPVPNRWPVRKRPGPAAQPLPIDYVPSGPPPRHVPPPEAAVAQPVMPSVMAGPSGGRPMMITWGPPPDVPEEAVKLNRQGIDQLLIGEIEEALTLFQRALDIAPHYEDAMSNHRELLTRLVQRRVSEWQAKQAEELLAQSEARAAQWAKRAAGKRRGVLGLFKGAEKTA